MNPTRMMMAIAELAQLDGGYSPDEAISTIAAMMDRLDPASEAYWQTMNLLGKIGATVWNLALPEPRPRSGGTA